jgi:hypothetical protein
VDVAGTSSQIFSTLYAQAVEPANMAVASPVKIEKQSDFSRSFSMFEKKSVITCKGQL